MKRKYYLRGLGIGILVTAIVFAFTGPKKMTDDEIIKRAEELGYVKAEDDPEATISLKDLLGTGTPTPLPTAVLTPVPTITDVPEATLIPTETPAVTPTAIPEPEKATATPEPTEPSETPTQQPTVTPTPGNEQEGIITAEISVERGNTATAVCNKIETAGIVEDGEALKEYMVEHHMTELINIGVYTLSSNMTYEEIARILTGQ